jgi:ribonucleoside-diphosphate reductase alpha chain
MTAYRQGTTRKGSYAAYMDADHPDIVEFIQMRVPTGDVNRKNLNLHHAVNLSDEFMEAVRDNGIWHLKDPNSKEVRDTMPARKLWEMLLETRYRTGEPYLNFIDTANRALPEAQKQLGLKIHGSNLCNEIHLATSDDRTAVCCLSSLNLERYDEWKDAGIVGDLIRFLDNVLQYFIDNAPDTISRAKYSAERERSLGLGAMGYHSYLQKHRIAFESEEALDLNKEMFKSIQEMAIQESEILAKERGEAPDMKGWGVRNAHLLAIAPNANSSLIGGTSPSIEPWKANAFTSRTRAGSHLTKNAYLVEVLEELNHNDEKTWSSIITNGGSVQHFDWMPDNLKAVFKTAIEIDQNWVVKQGGDRQKYLCQGQSLNIYFPAGATKQYLHKVHFNAWVYGGKGLYYLRTESSNRAENVAQKIERDKLIEFTDTTQENDDECVACQA